MKRRALWFKTSMFENMKTGAHCLTVKTYFASDIAYHKDKFDRRFDTHRYMGFRSSWIHSHESIHEPLGRGKDSLKVLLIQFVTLIKDGKPVGMSHGQGNLLPQGSIATR